MHEPDQILSLKNKIIKNGYVPTHVSEFAQMLFDSAPYSHTLQSIRKQNKKASTIKNKGISKIQTNQTCGLYGSLALAALTTKPPDTSPSHCL
jgi:hypothetical protein